MKKKIKFVIFASGNGSNLEVILKQVRLGRLKAEVPFCFSDRAEAKALARAKRLGFKTLTFSPKDFPSREAYEARLAEECLVAGADWIVLAGYMRLLGAKFVERFRDRIVNIHPALLPSFKGTHAIRDAWEYGVKWTGVTVHLVSEEMDAGPVLTQVPVEIKPGKTLAELEKRVHRVEHELYPETLKKLFAGHLKIAGRRTSFGK